MKSLKKNIIFNIIYNICNLAFPLVTSMYVSRILLPEGIGNISFTQTNVSYFVSLAVLGTATYGVREIAKVRENRQLTDKTFSELFLINASTTAVSCVLYTIFIFTPLSAKTDKKLAFIFAFLLIFNFINIDWLYGGEEEYVYIACRSIAVKTAALICVFLFVKTKEDYYKYAIITVLSLGGNYIFNIIHARKYARLTFKGLEFKKHLKPIIILALSIVLSNIYNKIDITMLGEMSTKTAVGLYNNAHKINELIIVGCTSISSVFLPRLSYYYENNREEFTRLIEKGVRILAFLTVPTSAGLFILAPKVVEIMYGSEFAPAATTVRIFTVLIMVKGFGNLLCYQLVICTGNEKQRLPAYGFACVANIVLNALLIPVLYQNGAAIASVISELIVNVYQFIKMRKIIVIPIAKKALLQAAISTALMSAAVFGVSLINIPLIFSCIASVAAGLAVYCGVNLIMKNEFLFEIINGGLKKLDKHGKAEN